MNGAVQTSFWFVLLAILVGLSSLFYIINSIIGWVS